MSEIPTVDGELVDSQDAQLGASHRARLRVVHRRRQDPRRAERFGHSLEAGSIRAYRIRAERIDTMGCKHSVRFITAQNHRVADVPTDDVVHEFVNGPRIAWRDELPGVGGHEVESVTKLDARSAQRA